MTDSYDHELVFVQPTKRSPSSREKIAQAVSTSNILGVLGESHARLRPSAPWSAAGRRGAAEGVGANAPRRHVTPSTVSWQRRRPFGEPSPADRYTGMFMMSW